MKYHKSKKHIGTLGIIVLSIIIAFAINIFLIDGTKIGNILKSNVLESMNSQNKADFFIEINNPNSFVLKNSVPIQNVQNIALSFAYNGENVAISELVSTYGEIIEMRNENGILSIILNLSKAVNIESKSKIFVFQVNKKENIPENINIINANFKDIEGVVYILSTQGINF